MSLRSNSNSNIVVVNTVNIVGISIVFLGRRPSTETNIASISIGLGTILI